MKKFLLIIWALFLVNFVFSEDLDDDFDEFEEDNSFVLQSILSSKSNDEDFEVPEIFQINYEDLLIAMENDELAAIEEAERLKEEKKKEKDAKLTKYFGQRFHVGLEAFFQGVNEPTPIRGKDLQPFIGWGCYIIPFRPFYINAGWNYYSEKDANDKSVTKKDSHFAALGVKLMLIQVLNVSGEVGLAYLKDPKQETCFYGFEIRYGDFEGYYLKFRFHYPVDLDSMKIVGSIKRTDIMFGIKIHL